MVEKKQFLEILKRERLGKASAEELEFLNAYYNLFELEPDVLNQMSAEEREAIKNRMERRLIAALEQRDEATSIVPIWLRVAGIAAAVAAIVFGVWFYNNEVASSRKAPRNNVAYKNDIAPGKNTATLTLPNGSIIQLSDAKTGVVIGVMKDATQLTYNDGSLVRSSLRGGTTRQPHDEITSSQNAPRNDGVMLTASTPRGGTYQFTLPDGTHVWLNAASKISFPSQFSGANRKILLCGEAYFEVAKDSKHPFVVQSDGQDVTVLGTHFNINAYLDESSTKTTLLEGAVKVTASSLSASSLRGGTTRQPHDVVLKPGQQSSIMGANEIKVTTIDPDDAISWKTGEFKFSSEALSTIMRKVSRWYDVEVIYKDDIGNIKLTGSISRFENVSKLLAMLQNTKEVHFEIEGKRIIVSK